MAQGKIREAVDKGVDVIISSDLTCLIHLKKQLQGKEARVKVMHVADVLAS